MSPLVMVTAYFASSCWISTRSSVLVDIDLAAFHYKTYVLCNADVQQRITGHGDDVGEVALGESAEVGFVDQISGDDGGRSQDGRCGHAPVDERDELVGVFAVRDRGRIGADSDFHTGLVRGLDRGAGLG